jgi:predicted homoserine dehydrogenase-like protein
MEVLSKMATLLTRPQNENVLPESRSEVMVKFGVVGYGYWGPNVVRNLDRLDETEVVAVCDKSPAARRKVAKAYPDVLVTGDPRS